MLTTSLIPLCSFMHCFFIFICKYMTKRFGRWFFPPLFFTIIFLWLFWVIVVLPASVWLKIGVVFPACVACNTWNSTFSLDLLSTDTMQIFCRTTNLTTEKISKVINKSQTRHQEVMVLHSSSTKRTVALFIATFYLIMAKVRRVSPRCKIII